MLLRTECLPRTPTTERFYEYKEWSKVHERRLYTEVTTVEETEDRGLLNVGTTRVSVIHYYNETRQ